MALVKVRIDLERTLRQLAQKHDISSRRSVVCRHVSQTLSGTLRALDAAVHGVDVSANAAAAALDAGTRLLDALRQLVGGSMRDEGEQSSTTICEACGTAVPSYDVVSYGSIDRGYRELCTRCFNAEVASVLGLERLEHVQLQPIVMTDCAGEKHEFHFGIRLLGHVMALDAFELKAGVPAGYQFEMLGEPDGEPLSLLASLIERIRRSLSVRYLERCEDDARIVDQTVCGRIEWDASGDGRVPLLVIDGQDVSWNEFGRMLMSFEGWQFRVAIRDRSEEV